MRCLLTFLFISSSMLSSEVDSTGLQHMAAQFAPAPLRVDTTRLSSGDRQALVRLIEAGRVIDDIFLDQLWSGNRALEERLAADRSPLGKTHQELFQLYKGPWSDLDNHRAFLPGVSERKPPGANFYP